MEKLLSKTKKKKIVVCLVCDFFYPRLGGVEVHVYQLSVALIRRNCKVIILTHHYKNRQGVKYMGNGVKVYYLPNVILVEDTIAPILSGFLPGFREIMIKEDVDIVHCHQSTSVMGLQAINAARTLGKHVVYTDHSLFGFDDLACVNINKVLKSYLTDVDQTISVSNIGRDNLILRAYLNPRMCNVIPNAVDFTKFTPDRENAKPTDSITIVSVSRQTYRKGTDLLIEIIPELCNLYPNIKFLIGGDGPKKILLENMVEISNLQDRVKLPGSIQHHKVRDAMIQGHIYLNTSLTEAFCIAILEAASTGLYVVATDVGGVGEVLPESMITLVESEKSSIIEGVKSAIEKYQRVKDETLLYHDRLKSTYNWDKVVSKTLQVYDNALQAEDRSIINRIKKSLSIGKFSGFFYIALFMLDYLLLLILCSLFPKRRYKKDVDFDYDIYRGVLREKFMKNENK